MTHGELDAHVPGPDELSHLAIELDQFLEVGQDRVEIQVRLDELILHGALRHPVHHPIRQRLVHRGTKR
jgi:hypothetical protein